jgi:regulator of protease activity HflC (stomatin/prohibitin superfamily)
MSVIDNLKQNKLAVTGIGAVIALLFSWLMFSQMFYYNNAGYITQVTTKFPFQGEKVVETTGYTWIGFGNYVPWPRQMSVQSVQDVSTLPKGDFDGLGSSLIPAFPVTFLGGVVATVDANVRVALPGGETFLQLARTYRTPDNFVLQSIMPVMKSTLQSTAQLMSADDYYNGGATGFRQSFQDQITDGPYVVKRVETQVKNTRPATAGAVAQDGKDQGEYGGDTTTVVTTEKVIDPKTGLPVRLERQFSKLGVTVADANIVNIDPSTQFKERMKAVQQSQADLSIARQGRQTADEQKKLATSKGEMETEIKRQFVLRDQAERTTNAETERRLAVTNANRQKEQAEIEKQTSQVRYEQALIDAKTTKEKAEAEAYAKKAVIMADGALTQKLNTWLEGQKVMANAIEHAKVPQIVMGSAGEAGGRQSEVTNMLNMMGIKAAKDLMLDMSVTK